ncbi:methyltransferase [archaeon]|jgi:release factor glutamine methyltransferase|nr:methyltransferase [archaeon]MBT6182841.1 methyltransferase [archaeon]MBT6606801.1 methyltransferase [archaeon]MBT7251726.1 methyltransferase [archaeon]MBT7660509.1 methyltransferase [archaeon]
MEIYEPSDDSFFFKEFLENFFSKKSTKEKDSLTFLDMGTGSGILALTATKFLKKENITAADINEKAIKKLNKQKINKIHTNLFKNLKNSFDIIVFNAPYLPQDKREPKDSQLATTGGLKGDEISLKFIQQAKDHLNKNGKIFLLISSLTPMNKIKKFSTKIVARKKIFMEELLILEFN